MAVKPPPPEDIEIVLEEPDTQDIIVVEVKYHSGTIRNNTSLGARTSSSIALDMHSKSMLGIGIDFIHGGASLIDQEYCNCDEENEENDFECDCYKAEIYASRIMKFRTEEERDHFLKNYHGEDIRVTMFNMILEGRYSVSEPDD